MVAKDALIKFGLTEDKDNFKLKEFFKDKTILKEVHMDLYPDNPLIYSSEPFMLLSRAIEKNVTIENDNERLILKTNDNKCNTYFINILFQKIAYCYYKHTNDYHEFIFNIQNIYYRIVIFN